MRINTKDLKPGAIMLTGEIVLVATKSGKSYMKSGPKMVVTLRNPKTDKRRLVDWSYYGTIGVRSE